MKTMALDHLGVIAARLRSSMSKFQETDISTHKKLSPLDEVCMSTLHAATAGLTREF